MTYSETFIQLIVWIFRNIQAPPQNMTIMNSSVPSVVKGSCNKPRLDRNHTESSIFLKPVNGSKIWILNWFMKLNHFMCFSFLFLKNPWKIFHSIHLQTGIKENYVVEIQIVCADQNYIITVGKNDILTGRYFNVSLLSTACVC